MAALASVGFRYAERGDAMMSAKEWSRRMGIYDASHVLTGNRLLGRFPAEEVVECLGHLTPNNRCIIV